MLIVLLGCNEYSTYIKSSRDLREDRTDRPHRQTIPSDFFSVDVALLPARHYRIYCTVTTTRYPDPVSAAAIGHPSPDPT